jgi:hypothetical protein
MLIGRPLDSSPAASVPGNAAPEDSNDDDLTLVVVTRLRH